MIRCAVVGAAGYSGVELISLLCAHPGVELVALFGSDRSASTPVSHAHPRLRGVCDLPIEPATPEAIAAARCDAVFLCTPHQASHDLAPALLESGAKVFDLSAAFRLKDAALYPRHYGFTHARPDLLGKAAYGMAELHHDQIAQADLVAVPGCYPTSAILALRPLVDAGALDTSRRLIVDSISGVSGAGRSAQLKTLFCEVSVTPYEVLSHRHTPEMSAYAGAPVIFTPHIGPYDRGIVSTIHAEVSRSAGQAWNADSLRAVLEKHYAERPFVRVLPAGVWPSVAGVRGTNFCDIAVATSPDGHVVIASAIDNLVKGAAGQAVQCMNIRFNLPETVGLLPSHAPDGVRA